MEETSTPLRLKIAIAFAALAVFSLVTAISDSDMGAAAGFAFSAIVAAAYGRWDLRRKWFYWTALAGLATLHIVLLTFWHPSMPNTIQVAPLAVLDFILMICILTGLDKLLDAD